MAALVFAHANGFPAGTYRVLFEAWRAAGWTVHAPERLGHDPRFPVSSNWPHLRDELLHHLDREVRAPAYLVGHSLGGFLSLMAALERPGRVRGVVLLDAPVLSGLQAQAVRLAKLTGLIGRLSPGRASRHRRDHWPSRAAAQAHFASRPLAARWDPRVLADYLDAGLQPVDPDLGPDGAGGAADAPLALRFRRDVETRIYETLPDHLHRLLRRGPPGCPVAFIGGRDSAEVARVGLRATLAATEGRIGWLDGGHLFPLERPQATAEAVAGWLAAFSREPGPGGRGLA